jgi:hypothetical protein
MYLVIEHNEMKSFFLKMHMHVYSSQIKIIQICLLLNIYELLCNQILSKSFGKRLILVTTDV